MKILKITSAILILLSSSIQAAENSSELDRIAELEKEIKSIKEMLVKKDEAEVEEAKIAKAEAASGIKIGGAVRFIYDLNDYDADNQERGGDIDFDTFRLNVDGTVSDLIISAEYRWYQYMDVIHHADIGYQFNDNWLGKIGITQVPFGVLPYNSNSFFFNTTFYVGLEVDFDAGISFAGNYGNHDINVAFFKSDEQGGLDGYVDNRSDRYSYDIVGVRAAGDGTFSTPTEGLAEDNTFNLRYAYNFGTTEVGASLLYGGIEGETGDAGDRHAYAFHVKSSIDQFTFMFQYTSYEYDLDTPSDFIAVGAYSFFDTIPTSADIFNLNLSYNLPVSFGPVSSLTFYNDFNIMTNKSGNLSNDTILNVSGVGIAAGPVWIWADLALGQNQPFVGGSLAGDSDEMNTRFFVNVGYYF